MSFFFNPADEIEITRGNLPHWYQKGVYYFVTFRLADSIPKEKAAELKKDRENWLKTHKNRIDFSKADWAEYNRLFHDRVEEWLNNGYGSCVLRNPKNAAIMVDALTYFDHERYHLDEWVVMPNHVHVLVKPVRDHPLSQILHSWKSYTALQINRNEDRSGELWMSESFDHIVRSESSLERFRCYIWDNPKKAGIIAPAASRSS